MSINLPVSVRMLVEPEDDEDLDGVWTPIEILRYEAADVSVRDVCEVLDDGERDYLDKLASAAEDVE